MASCLIILILVGGIGMLCAMALPRRWYLALPLCLVVATTLFAMHPYVTQINFARLIELARHPYSVMQVSLVLVCEGLLVIWACHHVGMSGASGESVLVWPGEKGVLRLTKFIDKVARQAIYLPSPALLLGLVFMQSWLFHRLSHMPFVKIALLQSLGVLVILPGAAVLCRALLPQRDLRVEVRFLMAMVQLGLAVFLPMWGDGTMNSVNAYAVDIVSEAVVWAGLIALAFVGFGVSQHRIKRGRIAEG